MKTRSQNLVQSIAIGSLLVFGSLACSGCQVSVGGQTLPSAYYHQDDIQYMPRGPEFKLSREAAAQKAARMQIQNQR
jgi:hypothetical protein